jgi:mannosyltransferase
MTNHPPSQNKVWLSPHLALIIMLAVLLVASAVRWHQLGAQSLWYDEGVAFGHSQRTLPEMIPMLQNNVHVPAYFGSLALWEDFVGATEFGLRAWSVLFSIIAVALAYALGNRLYGRFAGITAALFVALNTFAIYYAQEARMYAMLSAVAGASMWVFAGFEGAVRRHLAGQAHRKVIQYAVALSLLNALGMYTHFSYALVMVAQGILWVLWLIGRGYGVVQGREHWQGLLRGFMAYFLLNVGTILLFLPWLDIALRQTSSQPNISATLMWEQMARILQGWLTVGITFEDNVGGMGIVMYFFALFGLLIPAHMKQREGAWWRMLLPVVWVLASVSIYWYLGLYDRYLRFLLPAQLGASLWLGRGAWVLWHFRTREQNSPVRYLPRFAAIFAVGAFAYTLANGLTPLYEDEQYLRDDYRALLADVERDMNEGDALIVSAPGLQEIVGYYYEGDEPLYPVPITDDPAQETRAIINQHDDLFVVLYGTGEQDPQGLVSSTLNSEAYPISDTWYGDVRLLRYATPATISDEQTLDVTLGDAIVLGKCGLE